MKSLNEILIKKKLDKRNLGAFSKACAEDLIANGYIYNPVFGWEKIEIIEGFALDGNMRGVPCVQDFVVEYKNQIISQKDENGKNTGNKEEKRVWYNTTQVIWRPNDNYLTYLKFKKDRWAKYDAEDYAIKINTPPAEEYY